MLDKIPLNLDEAVELITSDLNEASVQLIKTEAPSSVHFNYGMALRNAWKLWQKDTPLVKFFIEEYGIAHADDISGLILSAVWAKVREVPFDPHEAAERYITFWLNQKVNPTTLEAL